MTVITTRTTVRWNALRTNVKWALTRAFVEFGITAMPSLPADYYFVVDHEGKYVIDFEGKYVIAKNT